MHSNSPAIPTGYGKQTALLLPQLAAAGHEVTVSAFAGTSGAPTQWRDFTVLPGGKVDFGLDMLLGHTRLVEADLILTLMDTYKLYPLASQLAGRRLACWTPVDCAPLGTPDRATLERCGAVPIAMSEFGLQQLRAAGFEETMYAPHAVDTAAFAPPGDRRALREEFGIDDRFLVGICGANNDGMRKGYAEQFAAFREFHRRHPEALLMLHTIMDTPRGLNLLELAHDFGLSDCITFPDTYAQLAGLMLDDYIAGWYGALDVLSCCSLGEGFGVPIVEAQACGTPVVVTDVSAMPELVSPSWGWKVGYKQVWNPTHRAWWGSPVVEEIVDAYEDAFAMWGTEVADKARAAVRESVLRYDSAAVFAEYWSPILKTLEAM